MGDKSEFWIQDHIAMVAFMGFLVFALLGVLGSDSEFTKSISKPIPISFQGSGGITGYSVSPIDTGSSCDSIADCPSYCIDDKTAGQASGCYLGFCVYTTEPCGGECTRGVCTPNQNIAQKDICGDGICQAGETCAADCGGVAGITKNKCEAYGAIWSECEDGSCVANCACGPISDYSCPPNSQCAVSGELRYGACI